MTEVPVVPVENISVDLTEMTEQIKELNENLTVPEVIEVDGVEMNQTEVLKEILTTLQPNEEELLNQADLTATNQELLISIKTSLEDLNVFNEEQLLIQEEQHVQITEGFFFVGLSVVVAFAVYMFWNQLSKW